MSVASAPSAALAPPRPSSPALLALRCVLAVLLALSWANTLRQPVERPLEHLLADLEAGSVASVTLQRPAGPDASGGFVVAWTTTGGHRAYATYVVPDASVESGPTGDEQVLAAVDRSPRPVALTVQDMPILPDSGPLGWLAGLACFAALCLLIAGPQPHLATKWAWFWLAGATPLWIAFLLLEPVPAWSRAAPAPRRRLTGGWAFVLSLTLLPVLLALVGLPHR
ncbi:hypothetical protein [Georgenia thermotolerans]|uniref:Uncharacterized protein n=1 Tax=Georgenia thermotolerans TaxID=527326 RepID=A0A7J5UQ50_9MICO|nr:hypothetical protein [Georgenia thermotolerans]KAE8764479.1 hypothetical protein GB883_08690 [Georgenia thermotolerans]